jgi:hypothetical protein
MGEPGRSVTAPIAPGQLASVRIAEQRWLADNEAVPVRKPTAWVLALDGERDLEVRPDQTIWLRVNRLGPRVIDPRRAIGTAGAAGAFLGPAG